MKACMPATAREEAVSRVRKSLVRMERVMVAIMAGLDAGSKEGMRMGLARRPHQGDLEGRSRLSWLD
jgi:hypothetical protein